MNDGNTVGISAPRVEGEAKVSGQAAYAADINLPEQLWVKMLRSPMPHGRIKKIDIQQAMKIPGVKAILTYADVQGVKIGKKIIDMPLLADGVVRYVGEKIAAVAAENEASAEAAIAQIVVEFEELEVVTDLIEAAKPSAPVIHPDVMSYQGLLHELDRPTNVFVALNWQRGHVDDAFAQADLIVENTFTTPMVHQGYIEPHCCTVKAGGKGAEIWASSKSPFGMRDHLGLALGLRTEDIIVHPGYIGGDFGGKGDANDIAVCYVLSKNTGRPVKFLMDYTEELVAGNPRHASTTTVKTGVHKNGIIVAQHITVLFDSGAYGSYRPQGYLVGAHSAAGPYKIPNLLIEEKYVYTNKVPCGYMRAPGHPQVYFATESQLDIIAEKLTIEPAQLRRMNFIHDGDEDPAGDLITHIRPDETLQSALETSGYSDNKRPYRGRGFAVAHWVSKGGESYVNVRIEADGVITLGAALVDVGPGAYTMMRQIVAQELSVPLNDVRVETLDTTAVIKDTGVRGSSSTRVHGNASYDAVEKARGEILRRASAGMSVPIEELSVVNGGVTHTKSERRMTYAELVKAQGSPILGEGHYANMTDGPEASMVVQVAEVEVDPETGQLTVHQITSAHNTGTVLNPTSHQGQIDGGVVMGMGFALTEEIRTEDGRISTANLGDYKLPNIKDTPMTKLVVIESPNGSGPYGSMSIGETAVIPVAAAIANAVKDAVGVRITSLPITAEKINAAVQDLKAHG